MVSHRVITESPPNVGVKTEGLTGELLSQQQMYVRCNFQVPRAVPDQFELVLPGKNPRQIGTGQSGRSTKSTATWCSSALVTGGH